MTAARDQLHPTILTTRNRFVLNRAHGFESHHLRQKSQIQRICDFFFCVLLLRRGSSPGGWLVFKVCSLLHSLQRASELIAC